ncbi:hypothetical protein PG989_005442 [Apiospora arundinis]
MNKHHRATPPGFQFGPGYPWGPGYPGGGCYPWGRVAVTTTAPNTPVHTATAATTTKTPKFGDSYESLLPPGWPTSIPDGWPWTGTNRPPTFPCGMYPVSVTTPNPTAADTPPTPTLLTIATTPPGLAAMEKSAAAARSRGEGGSWEDFLPPGFPNNLPPNWPWTGTFQPPSGGFTMVAVTPPTVPDTTLATVTTAVTTPTPAEDT